MGEAGKHRVSQNVAVRNTFRTFLFAAAAYPNQQVVDFVSPPSYRRDLLVVARHTAIISKYMDKLHDTTRSNKENMTSGKEKTVSFNVQLPKVQIHSSHSLWHYRNMYTKITLFSAVVLLARPIFRPQKFGLGANEPEFPTRLRETLSLGGSSPEVVA